jgi:hypothetical protein
MAFPIQRARKWALKALLLTLVIAGPVASGCIHKVLITTEPEGATILVDGEEVGVSPVEVNERTGLMGTMHVRAERPNYIPTETLVEQDEWYPWPGIMAVTPCLGAPTLLIPGCGPFLWLGWAIITSPTVVSLAFIRKSPDVVRLVLEPTMRLDEGHIIPTDVWVVPDDYSPNPIPMDPEEETSPDDDGSDEGDEGKKGKTDTPNGGGATGPSVNY